MNDRTEAQRRRAEIGAAIINPQRPVAWPLTL